MQDCTKDDPRTDEDLEKCRERLAKMSDSEVARFYDAAWHVCRLDRGKAPRAPCIQQLVQAWREMLKRERKGS